MTEMACRAIRGVYGAFTGDRFAEVEGAMDALRVRADMELVGAVLERVSELRGPVEVAAQNLRRAFEGLTRALDALRAAMSAHEHLLLSSYRRFDAATSIAAVRRWKGALDHHYARLVGLLQCPGMSRP